MPFWLPFFFDSGADTAGLGGVSTPKEILVPTRAARAWGWALATRAHCFLPLGAPENTPVKDPEPAPAHSFLASIPLSADLAANRISSGR